MALFFGKKKPSQEGDLPTDDEELGALIKQMMENVLGFSELSPEEVAEIEESQKRSEEERITRYEEMIDAGVDVDLFSNGMIEEDAYVLLDYFVPIWRSVNTSSFEKRAGYDFKPLTKAGKVPKNAVSGSFSLSKSNAYAPGKLISVVTKYKADGSVNMADLTIGLDGKYSYKASVRMVDGEYRITKITKTTIKPYSVETIYSEKSPSETVSSIRLLETELKP